MSQFNVTTRCDGCSLFHRIHLSLPQTVIALAAKYRQEKYQNHQGNDPWRPAAKNHLLGSLATKKSEAQLELPKRQENVSPAKDITLLGG